MHPITRHALAPLIAVALAMAAGASDAQTRGQDALKAATDRANAIRAATGAKPATLPMPAADPCAAVTPQDLQTLFPGARAGERTNRLSEFGIDECQWKNGADVVVLIARESRDGVSSAKDDAIGIADIYTGMKGNAKNVRIETFPGLGVDNAAFAEARDAARGIPNDFAFVDVRKGEHDLQLSAPGLAGRDRARVLKALEMLARQAAGRL